MIDANLSNLSQYFCNLILSLSSVESLIKRAIPKTVQIFALSPTLSCAHFEYLSFIPKPHAFTLSDCVYDRFWSLWWQDDGCRFTKVLQSHMTLSYEIFSVFFYILFLSSLHFKSYFIEFNCNDTAALESPDFGGKRNGKEKTIERCNQRYHCHFEHKLNRIGTEVSSCTQFSIFALFSVRHFDWIPIHLYTVESTRIEFSFRKWNPITDHLNR